MNQIGPAGLEPATKSSGHQGEADTGGAESGTVDPILAKIVAAWASLPQPVRRAMLALLGRQ